LSNYKPRLTLAANCLDKLARFFRNSRDMKTRIPPVLITFALVCFALVQNTQAVSPAPDGGYPGFNTAEGTRALFSLSTGIHNTAVGGGALQSLTTGNRNTAIGSSTLVFNNGDDNTATGFRALYYNTTGSDNTATGRDALTHNTTANDNTANGFQALFHNGSEAFGIEASNNTATGSRALFMNTTGYSNTANGGSALFSNATGTLNTATGLFALSNNIRGNSNTAIGAVALGNTTGDGNIAVGDLAGVSLTTGNNNIDVGNQGVAAESNAIRIGIQGTQTATFVAGISGATLPNGVAVVIDTTSGQLGIAPSSQRFKAEIKPMDKASEAILALKPVTFRYKKEIDPNGVPQFGLVAEEVAKVSPDLVTRDAKGEVYTVRYDQVNAMLLNEFLKEHGKVEKLQATVTKQQKQIEALTEGLQKVSAQLEASKSAPQVVNNP
jgi:hypothetical protein